MTGQRSGAAVPAQRAGGQDERYMAMKHDAHEETSGCRRNERGIALLLVLWIITLLGVMCAELSWTMRTQTAIVTNFKEGEQAYYTAEAGVNKAIVELVRLANRQRQIRRADDDAEEDEARFWEPGSAPYTFEFAGGLCEVSIEDESNKLGLNAFLRKAKRTPKVLKDLLRDQVGLEGDDVDLVADSLIDWWDTDRNVTGVNGAEGDYYDSLDPPYQCRNGDIPVVEELLMVRGVDSEVFYGSERSSERATQLTAEDLERLLNPVDESPDGEEEDEDNPDAEVQRVRLGLSEIFSTVSRSQTFTMDINTASAQQLTVLEGMDMDTAREIVRARVERKFSSTTDRLPGFPNYEIWKNSIKVRRASSLNRYRITARGLSPDRRISRSVACNVMISKRKCVIMDWKTVD